MLKHYLTSALRNFRRHWITTSVSVLGLALGFLCVIGALNLVHYFKLDDSQYPGSDRTYFLSQEFLLAQSVVNMNPPWVAAKHLKSDLTELEVARVVDYYQTPITVNGSSLDARTSFADADLLKLFPLPFVQGDRATALSMPGSAVITQHAAKRLFGTDDVLGKTFFLYGTELVTIAGVVTVPIQPTHLLNAFGPMEEDGTRFEILASMDMLVKVKARESDFETANRQLHDWHAIEFTMTYVRLPASGSVDLPLLNARLEKLMEAHADKGMPRRLFARPIADYRQRSLDALAESNTTGLSGSTLLLSIAGVILLIASLNCAILAAAIAAQHRKEQGIRRTLGAATSRLIIQHWIEVLLLIGLAAALAFATLAALNPLLRSSRRIDLLYVWSHSAAFWWQVLALLGIVSLVASTVPILATLRMHPTLALRQSRGGAQGQLSGRWLVGAQFLLVGVLLVFLFVVRLQQHELVEHAHASISGPVVAIQNNLRSAGVNFGVLRNELLRQPHVTSVTSSSYAPWNRTYGLVSISNSQDDNASDFRAISESVDDEYFSTLKIDVLAGKVFKQSTSSGSQPSESQVVLDRTAVKQLGWPSPQAAVGQQIYPGSAGRKSHPDASFRIIGVVEDRLMQFTTSGASFNIYFSNANAGRTPLVRLSTEQTSEGYAEIQSVWKRLAPNFALRANFVDEIIDRYAAETAVYADALSWLALLAVAIALAGLIGMSIHVVNQRMHEIGIRKTLGARPPQITMLLLNDFSRPVILGSIIGWPLAYLIAQTYLDVYLHRISLNALPFIAGLAIVLAISFAAVGWHTVRAARRKPSAILRHE